MRKKVFAGVLGLAMLLGLPADAAAPSGNAVPVPGTAGEDAGRPSAALPEPPGPVAPDAMLPEGQAPSQSGGQDPAMPVPADPAVPAVPEQPVQSAPAEESKAPQQEPQPLKIVINLASRSLAVYEGDQKIRLYPVGVGTTGTPTPTGYYKIRSKDVNPTWTDPKDPSNSIPSGPSNPLGYRWMEIKGNYGIHGTNNPGSVGHYVSNGCIRLQEKDVEALFDLVEIGTPVEITYNRVVVEKTPENIVAYYIYPDGYYRQKLDVATVNQWLAGYGVSAFESDEDIARKIEASDGQPTYIGAIYGISVNGKRIPANAVARDNVIYLPAVPIAESTATDLHWDAARSMLVSPHGEAPGLDKKGQLYLKAADARTLFRMAGTLQADNVFSMQAIQAKPSARPALERNAEAGGNWEASPDSGNSARPALERNAEMQPMTESEPTAPHQGAPSDAADQQDSEEQTRPAEQTKPMDQKEPVHRPVFDRDPGSNSTVVSDRPVISQSHREV